MKKLTSVFLAFAVLLGTMFCYETSSGKTIVSISANAATINDVRLSGPSEVTLTGTEGSTYSYYFSGDGIASVSFKTTGDVSVEWNDIKWAPYPQECRATCTVHSTTGTSGGTLTFYLDDGYGGQPYWTTTTFNVASQNGFSQLPSNIPETLGINIQYNNMSFPSSITKGNGQHINGKITSSSNITAIKAEVIDTYGNIVLSKSVYPNAKSYSLYNSSLDYELSFGTLSAGKYTLNYTTASGGIVKSYSHSFSVNEKAAAPAAPTISYNSMSFPASFTQGNGQHINGNVTSTANISSLKAVVTNSYGNVVLNKSVNPNSKSYSLYNSSLDYGLSFGSLSAGTYTLTYTATSGSTTKSYSHSFTVKEKVVAPTINYNSMSFPTSFTQGNGQHINGNITSTANISSLKAVVTNSYGNVVLNKSVNPNSKSYSLYNSSLDYGLSFGSLSAGTYTLTYTATSGSTTKSYSHSFAVKEKVVAPTISYNSMSFPTSFTQGNGQHINGNITSTANISSLKAVVTNSYGNVVLNKSVNPNSKSYSLYNSSLDNGLSFGSLSAGTYTLTYTATSGSTTKSYSHSFTVKEKVVAPTISYNSMSFPTSITRGSGQHINGNITSAANISSVYAAITNSSGNTVLSKTVYPNSKTYSLNGSALDNALTFGSLSAGTYTLKYTAKSGSSSKSYSHSFTVKEKATAPTATANISFSSMSFPSSITRGSGQHINGKITSTANINSVYATVTNSSGKTVLSKTAYPNSKSYSLYNSDIDKALAFGSLSVGNYKLTYTVKSGTTSKNYTHSFSVDNKAVPYNEAYNTTSGNNAFQEQIRNTAKAQAESTSNFGSGGKPFCGFYAKYLIKTALMKAYNLSENQALKYIPKSITGAETLAYEYSLNGKYHSFSQWSDSYYSSAMGKNIKISCKNTDTYNTYTPKVGDIVLVNTNNTYNDPDHIGVIIKVNSDGSFWTSEANTSYGKVRAYKYVKSDLTINGVKTKSWKRSDSTKGYTRIIGICEFSMPNL